MRCIVLSIPSQEHVSFRQNCKIRGNSRFISYTTHCINWIAALYSPPPVMQHSSDHHEIQGRNIGIHNSQRYSELAFALASGERQSGVPLWNVSSAFFKSRTWLCALMGHARAFTRKLWKSTVTICGARLDGRAETARRAEGRGWKVGVHQRFRMERGNGHLSFASVLFFHLHFRTLADFS